MPAKVSRFRQFRAEIRQLIDEVEQHMRGRPPGRDREYLLQRKAFEERREHARRLTAEIERDEQNLWGLRDGDAERARESLRLSLDFFRTDA